MRRPPFTLWRAIFADLARFTLLTAGVLVVVIAFGAVIKPLADGLLQASDTVKFMLLASPPMLAYALPFAAGFASTLVYHRLANDHESTAAYAGGVSHRAVLAPAVALGLACAAGLTLLNEQVSPRFLLASTRLISVDIARIVTQQIDKGKAAPVGKRVLMTADRAERIGPDAASGAVDQVVFTKLAAVELDSKAEPIKELTAAYAVLSVYPPDAFPDRVEDAGKGEETSVAVLQLSEALAADRGVMGGFREGMTVVFRVPNAFRDKPKFLTYGALRGLREHPEALNWVNADRVRVATLLGEQDLVGAIGKSLEEHGGFALLDADGHEVTVRGAKGASEEGGLRLLPSAAGGKIEVLHTRSGSAGDVAMETQAGEGVLLLRRAGEDGLTLELRGERTREAGGAFAPERTALAMHQMRPRTKPEEAYLALPVRQLADVAKDRAGEPTGEVRGAADKLGESLVRVQRETLAQVHERAAGAVACLVLSITGAVTALRLASRMPLTIYLWTFLPSLACMVTVSGGQQTVRQAGASGLVLLWGGVGLLAVYTLVMLRSLAKH